MVSELVALRNFVKKNLFEYTRSLYYKDMDQDLVHMLAASKVPMLKPENGNAPLITKVVEGVETIIAPTTAEEKAQRSTSSTNRAVNSAHDATTASTQATTVNSTTIDNLSDDVIRDGLEVADGFANNESKEILEKTRRKLTINGNETIGFDKSKVECYNCHKKGHFVRECRAPRNQENMNRENTRRVVPVETTTSNALVSCDGSGYDWSDQAEEVPTNFALMAYSSTSSNSEGNCHRRGHFARECKAPKNQDSRNSETTRRTVPVEETTSNALVSQCDGFGSSSSDTENEVVFKGDIKILKLDIMLRDNALTELRKKFEKAKKERDDLKLTLKKFENSSNNLSKLLDSQVSDKFKTGVGYDSQVFDNQMNDKYKSGEGYHVVPPPYTGNFMPPKPDLVLADKDEYIFSESVTSVSAIATSKNENEIEFKSRQRKPSNAKVKFVKSNEHVKSPRESVKKVENYKQVEYPRKNCQSPRVFNHLIKDCDYYEKKMVEKPVWNNARRVNHQNSQRITHPHPKRNFVPSAVLMKSGLKTLNTARQNSSRAALSVSIARPINTCLPKTNSE
ncbi:retrovirus-related pol polyprotein from transposon TNT 1-94 [Tanacetum coccineum]|uniref:Retrovirus-related pol polyprotein from transposon TNT 1-94 n=1 Tax=Tanacetum coccineum TaxID=301880 RepID=A0ABQ5AAI0_9ASTR